MWSKFPAVLMTAFSQVTLDKGLHQAAALAAMTLLLTTHRAIMNTGFVLRQKGWSTDFVIALTVGIITSIWSLLVIVSGLFLGEQPCRQDFDDCVARLSYAPWIIQILFLFWIVALVDQLWYLKWKEARRLMETGDHALTAGPSDVEASRSGDPEKQTGSRVTFTAFQSSSSEKTTPKRRHWLSSLKPLKIWKLDCGQGPLNWTGSVHWTFRTLLYATTSICVAFFSYGAARQELYTIALLNIVGVVLFIVGAGGANPYTTAPHAYTRDTLRIILQTDHKEGTVYVLPTKDRGFDAVWSPKIESEHKPIDTAIADWRAKGGYGQSALIDMGPTITSFYTSTKIDREDVISLADWLYEPGRHRRMCAPVCNRAPGIHLLSSGLMQALWSAEYLVFMRRGELRPDQGKYLGMLRNQKWSGADINKDVAQIGSRAGLDGYQDAVRYIYDLFDQPVDQNALHPTASPPKTSIILGDACPDTIEGYVGALWDHCRTREATLFVAMWAFCQYWMADNGNGNGWHGFPFRAVDREGDMVSWHVVWRQGWYLAIIAQLTSMSPIIFSAFLAGILQ